MSDEEMRLEVAREIKTFIESKIIYEGEKCEITGNEHIDEKLFQVAYSLSEYV